MKWMATALMLLAIVPGIAAAQAPQPAAPQIPSAQTAAPQDETCHGPRYFQIKAEAQEQRERELARAEMERFIAPMGHKIDEGLRLERQRIITEMADRFHPCLKMKRHPSFFCTALGKRDPDLCRDIPFESHKDTCMLVVPAANSFDSGDPAQCDLIKPADDRTFCKFLAAKEFACEQMVAPALVLACPLIKAVVAGQAPAAKPPEEQVAASYLAWLMAIATKTEPPCAMLPLAEFRGPCMALVSRDPSVCPDVRPTVEHVDLDWSCRNVLAYKAVHDVTGGQEIVVGLGNAYNGNAKCTVDLTLSRNSVVEHVSLGPVEIPLHGTWAELRHSFGAAAIVDVQPKCEWDRETSRYLMPGEDINGW